MANVIGSPSRYVQGRGELAHLYEHCEKYGKDLFVLVSASGKKRVEGKIAQSVEGTGAKVVYETFNGECSQKEIDRVVEVFKASGCSVVVGIGGGKIDDTAKAAAYYAGAPVVIVPTIASTDAPCSALSVIYTDEGVFDRYLFLPANPTVVLVDTDIVAAAPPACWCPAWATHWPLTLRPGPARPPVHPTVWAASDAGRHEPGLVHETLLADGLKAKLAVERHVCTTAVENVIEANTYLSGVGFESGGLAGAHAIHNGLTAIPETHSLYHGEKVAFGTLVQLVLENAPLEELEEVLEFCTEVGLPTTLADLGVENPTQEQLMEVAEAGLRRRRHPAQHALPGGRRQRIRSHSGGGRAGQILHRLLSKMRFYGGFPVLGKLLFVYSGRNLESVVQQCHLTNRNCSYILRTKEEYGGQNGPQNGGNNDKSLAVGGAGDRHNLRHDQPGVGHGVPDSKKDERGDAAHLSGLCSRCNDCGFGVEPADSGY